MTARIAFWFALSIAFPIASLNVLASTLVLGGHIAPRQWLGAALITCGVVIVAHAA